MFKIKYLLFLFLCSFINTDLAAQNMVCAYDLDGDGVNDAVNETSACIQTDTSFFCPINAVSCDERIIVSELDEGGCSSNGGVWDDGIIEEEYYSSGRRWSVYDGRYFTLHWGGEIYFLPLSVNTKTIDGWVYTVGSKESGSKDSYKYSVIRTKKTSDPYCYMEDGTEEIYISPIEGRVCEIINNMPLVPVADCLDLDIDESLDEYSVSGDMLFNDGATDAEGNCTAITYLFTGRAQACKKPGFDSAYQNCCSYDGEIANADTGSYQQTQLTIDAISGIYDISKAAYTAYSASLSAGATSSAAASAAGAAAGDAALVAFDPTSLAIAATIYLVTDWVANACSMNDLDTAAAKASGHCVEIGSYCSKSISGVGCIQKERSFCCFNGKMQRIFQEQGRPQLNTFSGWGTAKQPDCRGFTPEEFQSIDFSKIDLSEYYGDLKHNSSTDVNNSMTSKTEEFYESIQ